MADKKTNYLIYGDDNRIKNENLDDLALRADEMLAIQKGKLIESRYKNRKKGKKKFKPGDFAQHVSGDLSDIRAENTDNLSPASSSETSVEKNTSLDASRDLSGEKPEEGKKPKKRLKKWVLIVIAALLAMFLAALLWMLFGGTREPQVNEEPSPTASVSALAATPTPAASYTVSISEGYLPEVSLDKTYSLSETLTLAKALNDTSTTYLDHIVDVVQRAGDSQDVNVDQELAEDRARLSYDMVRLENYEHAFDPYHGISFVRAAVARMENINEMYGSISNNMTAEDMVTTANRYIENENTLADSSKKELIDYLTFNEVQYTEEGDEIRYDTNQFTASASPDAETSADPNAEENVSDASASPDATPMPVEEVSADEASAIVATKKTDDAIETATFAIVNGNVGTMYWHYLGIYDSDEAAQEAAKAVEKRITDAGGEATNTAANGKAEFYLESADPAVVQALTGVQNNIDKEEAKNALEDAGYRCSYRK